MYDELVERLRFLAKQGKRYGMAVVSFQDAADAIEDLLRKTQQLEDKLRLAIGFFDSAEQAELIRKLSQFMPDISDPEWYKAHMEMGFYSPLGELYKEMGVYDEPPKEGAE